ncbi:MAG: DEAD/DEAH box helicase [Gammaproteobacteria bacterium]|nr:DEAD/DEAH box helicase [Gammaproteobacteria bacterium]
MPENLLTDVEFDSFELTPELNQGLADAGFEFCTPIQAKALPRALAGDDVAGQAQTGTGKTAAFLLALFQRLLTRPASPRRRLNDPRAMILAPTRELAIQIAKDAEILGSHTGLKIGLVYGGTDYEKQRQMLQQGVDVLIGTPGRFIDYFKQKIFSLDSVEVVVLDEADRMFDLGFIKDIRYLLRRLPPATARLNMLFSATLSQRVLELAYEHMNDPELIKIKADRITVDKVTQLIYFPANHEKISLLVGLLRKMDATRTMVFINTKRGAEHLESWLKHNGFDARAITGDVPQRKRQSMMRDFKNGKLRILIATDVASRGLHIQDVSHVFNYDLPQDQEDYVHRIGRTARAGASGDAISFGCEDYVVHLPDIEEFIEHRIPVGTITPDLLPELKRPPPRPRRSEHQRRNQRSGKPGGRGRSQSRRR